MKKVSLLLVVAILLMSTFAASAENATSPVAPAAVLEQVTSSQVETLPPEFVVAVLKTPDALPGEPEEDTGAAKASEKVTELFMQLDTVVKSEHAVEEIFKEEELKAIADILPAELEEFELTVTEFIPLAIDGYTEEIGDVDVLFTLPGEYEEEATYIAMFGVVLTDEEKAAEELAEEPDADDEPVSDAIKALGENVEWISLTAEAVDGKVDVTFTKDALLKGVGHETILIILRVD